MPALSATPMSRSRCSSSKRDAFLANPHPLGLLVSPGDNVELVENDLGRFASVAINFPGFTDGRGYSSARLLVERYGYKGELRAVGDVLQDQIPLMRRCGITAFVVKHEPTRKALERRQACHGRSVLPAGRHHRGARRHPPVPPPRGGKRLKLDEGDPTPVPSPQRGRETLWRECVIAAS